jgi:hypothetical protein
MLKTNYGFSDITKLTNASRRDIVLAISDLSKRVLPNDSVLVFYAGHGYLDQDSNKGFWVPVDANGTDHTTYLRNSTIRDELSTIASRSKHTLLVADSCFSGTLLRRGINPLSVANANEAYFRKVANKKSAQIITSGGIEFVDDDYKKSGHSPFTYFLLNELKYNDKPMLTVSELSSNVTKAVSNNVEQTPNSGVLAEAGDELGEFIFIKLKVKVDTKGIPLDKVKVEVELEPMDEQAPKQELRKTVEQPPVSDSPTVTKNESKPKANKSQDDVIYHIPSL